MGREKNRSEWKNTITKWNVSIDDEIGRESWQNFSPLFRWYAEQLKGEIRMKLSTSLLHPQHWWLATISRLNREIQQFDLDQSGRKCVWPTTIINNDPKRETGFPLIHHIDPVPHRRRSSTLALSLSHSLFLSLRLEFLYTLKMENRSLHGGGRFSVTVTSHFYSLVSPRYLQYRKDNLPSNRQPIVKRLKPPAPRPLY